VVDFFSLLEKYLDSLSGYLFRVEFHVDVSFLLCVFGLRLI
jgi:hypothetical protein